MAKPSPALPRRSLSQYLVKEQDGIRAPWMPGFRITLRLLAVARIVAALHANIGDCDETYNYWEPLHLLAYPPAPLGHGQAAFQTWEYAPQFALRSWAYIAQYLPVTGAVRFILRSDKTASFYAVRIVLGLLSATCEAQMLKTVSDVIHPRVARYMLVFLLFSSGMYASATALLPSTFAMYSTTLALSFAFAPATEGYDTFPVNRSLPSNRFFDRRALFATLLFALGALLAWPFALVLSLPFVFEQTFLLSGLIVPASRHAEFVLLRIRRWLGAVLVATLIACPIFVLDSLAYGRPVLVSLNIIKYNILSGQRGAGPTLYGTEPWHYYLLNLGLNFGPALPLALMSLPAVMVTQWKSATASISATHASSKKEGQDIQTSSSLTLLFVRTLPLYIWLGLLTLQPHKEERFMYPAYPLLCFNAAIGLHCVRTWIGALDRTKARKLASMVSFAVLALTSLFAVSRSWHTTTSYGAPFKAMSYLRSHELSRIVALTYPEKQSVAVQSRIKAGLAPVMTPEELQARRWTEDNKHDPYVDLAPLISLAHKHGKHEALRLCYGKEWHRFPTTFLVPNGVAVDFIASDFTGILPKHFARADESSLRTNSRASLPWPWKFATQARQSGFNDLNLEEKDRYVDVDSCDYLIDVDWSLTRDTATKQNKLTREKRFIADERRWTKLFCTPFLDAVHSRAPSESRTLTAKLRATVDRTLWLPASLRGTTNKYGEYCLLRTTRKDSLTNVVASAL